MEFKQKPTPLSLLPQAKAQIVARQVQADDDEWTYTAIPWGDKYWVIEIKDEIGVIGYI